MNSILESLSLARKSLQKNKMRTFLSVLGIAIGITSIVVIMSAGESLKHIFDAQLATFGSNYIQIEIKVPSTGKNSAGNAEGIAQGISITTLVLDDKKSVDTIPNISASYGAVLGQASVSSLYNQKHSNYLAASSEYQYIDTAGIAKGRFYSDEEERSLGKVVVLGSAAATTLFPNQDPIGQTIKMERVNFRVIGIFNERGSAGFVNLDEWIVVPLRTAQKLLLGNDHLSFIIAQMKDASIDDSTAQEITALIRSNHEISDPNKDDFAVTTQKESMAMITTILDGVTMVLGIIASIALIVGGVGIMNIMYVAVNERVFEIGLRKAIGARIRHIRNQFLVEAIVITLIGGVVGIILACVLIVVIYLVAGKFNFSWPLAFSVKGIVLSITFSSAIGIIFGYYPAKKASQLKPVHALSEKRGA